MTTSVQDPLSQLQQPSLSVQTPPNQSSLSQASVEMAQGSKPKRPLVILVIIVALLGGGLLGYLSLQQPVSQGTIPTHTPSPQPHQESIADDVGEQTISLRNVRGGAATGSATRTYTSAEPARIRFSISTNLPSPAAEGEFYQVWLADDVADVTSWVPLSTLWERGDEFFMEDEYTLPLASLSQDSYYAFSGLVVTLEVGDGANVTSEDGTVGERVLQGNFTSLPD